MCLATQTMETFSRTRTGDLGCICSEEDAQHRVEQHANERENSFTDKMHGTIPQRNPKTSPGRRLSLDEDLRGSGDMRFECVDIVCIHWLEIKTLRWSKEGKKKNKDT